MSRRGMRSAPRLVGACVVFLSVAGGGCARAANGTQLRAASVVAKTTTIIVRNHHGADLRIYVVSAQGASRRLGIAPRLGTAVMYLPSTIQPPAVVQFVVLPMSADDPQATDPILVETGMTLLFTVDRDVTLSTLVKRP